MRRKALPPQRSCVQRLTETAQALGFEIDVSAAELESKSAVTDGSLNVALFSPGQQWCFALEVLLSPAGEVVSATTTYSRGEEEQSMPGADADILNLLQRRK